MKTLRTALHPIVIVALISTLFIMARPAQAAVGTTFTVDTTTNLLEDNHCSLQEAIQAANSDASWTHTADCPKGSSTGTDIIHFSIGTGAQTITLASALSISGPVYIDGTTQAGYAGTPLIQITGSGTGLLAFEGGSNGSTIKALQLSMSGASTGYALKFEGSDGHQVIGNYINTNGSASLGNDAGGIMTYPGSNITIGGATEVQRNLFGGLYGIHVTDSSNDLIQGNYFGLQADGITPLTGLPGPDGMGVGIQVSAVAANSTQNTIRGNVLTGQAWAISLDGRSAGPGLSVNHTTIAGNMIGVGADGATARSNWYGIYIDGSSSNTIGGTTAADRNVLAGNSVVHIMIKDSGAVDSDTNVIQGNYIGVDASGLNPVAPAALYGVEMAGGTGNVIGGTPAGSGNVISGNQTGMYVTADASGTIIRGNKIGTDKDGLGLVANDLGLSLASPTNVGDESTPGNNLISGSNTSFGISVTNGGTVTIYGNKIGVSAAGMPLGNGSGVVLWSGSSAAIGGNWIGYSSNAGVSLESNGTVTSASQNCLTGNATGVQNVNLSAAPFANNWWGATNGPGGSGPGSGDPASAYVTFAPFLTSAPAICAPFVSLDTSTLSFGDQTVGTTSSAQTVTLTNTGTKPLGFTSITTAAPYSLGTGTCPTANGTLSTGASCTILVRFTPMAAGAASGSVTIVTDAASSPDQIGLSGTGIPGSGAVLLDPTQLTFTQLVGTSSGMNTVTLTNTGAGTLTLLGISAAAPYSLGAGTCPTSGGPLNASASCTILVKFSPLAAGPAPGTLVVTSNAASSPDHVTLNGTGVAGAQLLKNPSFELDANHDNKPDSYTFTNFNLATDKRDCTIRKAGTCSLKLAGNGALKTATQTLTKSGAAGHDFTFSLWSKATGVPAGSTYRLQVQFFNGTTSVGTKTLNFVPGTHGFQKVSGAFTAPGSYTKILFKITLKASTGTAWFDAGALNWAP